MYLSVDLDSDPPHVELQEREDCRRLHVEVLGSADAPGARSRLHRALDATGFGSLAGHGGTGEVADQDEAEVDGTGDTGDTGGTGGTGEAGALLALEALRAAAGRDRAPGWEADFDGMIAYARSKGWVTGDDRVRAHVVWPATG